jgi:hypothetical protein
MAGRSSEYLTMSEVSFPILEAGKLVGIGKRLDGGKYVGLPSGGGRLGDYETADEARKAVRDAYLARAAERKKAEAK